MTLRVLIADDERLGRARMRQLLMAEPGVQIVGESASGKETLEAVLRYSPDVIFLDVCMPDMDGFEVLQGLNKGRRPAVVFVSAHHRFALRAFEAEAVDFLLKPCGRNRVQEALRRARQLVRRHGQERTLEALSTVLAATNDTTSVRHFVVRSGDRLVLVRPNEIRWIQSADNYLELHVGKSVHLVRQTLSAFLPQLPPNQFWRISRSVMVNVDHIKEIQTKSHGDFLVLLKDGQKLNASRKFRDRLDQLFS